MKTMTSHLLISAGRTISRYLSVDKAKEPLGTEGMAGRLEGRVSLFYIGVF